jgi:hypothetical protein
MSSVNPFQTQRCCAMPSKNIRSIFLCNNIGEKIVLVLIQIDLAILIVDLLIHLRCLDLAKSHFPRPFAVF